MMPVVACPDGAVPCPSWIQPAVPSQLLVAPPVERPPVSARLVPVAAPITGVTSVGVFAKTMAPLPVSSEIFAAIPAESVRLVITPVVVATRMMPVDRLESACSAEREPLAVCVIYVAFVGAPPQVDEEVPLTNTQSVAEPVTAAGTPAVRYGMPVIALAANVLLPPLTWIVPVAPAGFPDPDTLPPPEPISICPDCDGENVNTRSPDELRVYEQATATRGVAASKH